VRGAGGVQRVRTQDPAEAQELVAGARRVRVAAARGPEQVVFELGVHALRRDRAAVGAKGLNHRVAVPELDPDEELLRARVDRGRERLPVLRFGRVEDRPDGQAVPDRAEHGVGSAVLRGDEQRLTAAREALDVGVVADDLEMKAVIDAVDAARGPEHILPEDALALREVGRDRAQMHVDGKEDDLGGRVGRIGPDLRLVPDDDAAVVGPAATIVERVVPVGAHRRGRSDEGDGAVRDGADRESRPRRPRHGWTGWCRQMHATMPVEIEAERVPAVPRGAAGHGALDELIVRLSCDGLGEERRAHEHAPLSGGDTLWDGRSSVKPITRTGHPDALLSRRFELLI
jgi:hypothetical protein